MFQYSTFRQMVQCKNGQERFSPLLPARCFYLLCGCAGSYFGSSSLRRCGFRRSSFAGCGICAAGHAALNDQLILIVKAVGIHQSLLIVLVEEVLFAQSLDLLVQPIQNGGVALAHSGSNGVLTAQRGNADRVAGVLLCKCNDLGVIVGPCHAVAVLQCILLICFVGSTACLATIIFLRYLSLRLLCA